MYWLERVGVEQCHLFQSVSRIFTVVPKCRMDTGTSAEVSWFQSVLGPKCPYTLQNYSYRSSTTRDLMLIQQYEFYWISNRSGVAELIYTITNMYKIVLLMQRNYNINQPPSDSTITQWFTNWLTELDCLPRWQHWFFVRQKSFMKIPPESLALVILKY